MLAIKPHVLEFKDPLRQGGGKPDLLPAAGKDGPRGLDLKTLMEQVPATRLSVWFGHGWHILSHGGETREVAEFLDCIQDCFVGIPPAALARDGYGRVLDR